MNKKTETVKITLYRMVQKKRPCKWDFNITSVMVNFLSATQLRNTQIAGTLFMDVSLRVFPEERSICISRPNRNNLPSPMQAAII